MHLFRMAARCLALSVAVGTFALAAQQGSDQLSRQPVSDNNELSSTYILGPEDQITIWALGAEEISDKSVRLDPGGYIDLPLLGRLRAGGLTVEQLKTELVSRLKPYVTEPQVSVRITEFKSQPISVIGAVNKPGVHQLEGRKTLVEILSMAGGLGLDAGNSVKITRRLEWGQIPLPTATNDPTGRFSVAEVRLRAVMQARNPEENIIILPYDVISVPRADMVYVMGEVAKPGGFPLNEQETLSVLQALSMAGGITRIAATRNTRILRLSPGAAERTEISLNLKEILTGRAGDVPLCPYDILFVPHNTAKTVGVRTLETAIGLGTGIMIWRR